MTPITCALFLAVILTVSQNTAHGFKCYSCINCMDPFNADGIDKVECTTVCVKTKTSASVVRACSPLKIKTTCQTSGENAVCGCDGELCNGVSKVTVSVATVLFAVIAKLF